MGSKFRVAAKPGTKYGTENSSSKWRVDTRTLLGVALVGLSALGVWAVVGASTQTTAVYLADTSLAAGDRLNPARLSLTQVNLGGSSSRYLRPQDLKNRAPAGNPDATVVAAGGELVVSRPISAGEIIPRSALVDASRDSLVNVVLQLEGDLGSGIREGELVDVWAASKPEGAEFLQTQKIAVAVRVVRITRGGNEFDGRSRVQVEVQAARSQLADLLDAVANRDRISLVNTAVSDYQGAAPDG